MSNANLYIGNTEVFTNAMFERIPVAGEYVAYDHQWRPVMMVGHTWSGSSNAPIVCISLGDPQGATEVQFTPGTVAG